MPYTSIPASEIEYLIDVERALADVTKPPPRLGSAPSNQAPSIAHALSALEKAGMRSGRADSLVRALRVMGIQRPGRFVVGLRSDYALASYRRSVAAGRPYLAEDEFEGVALLLQTILFHRADIARVELSVAAMILADKWLEAAGHDLPAEGPSVLHVAAFHTGVPVSERADALRQLVAWAKTYRTDRAEFGRTAASVEELKSSSLLTLRPTLEEDRVPPVTPKPTPE